MTPTNRCTGVQDIFPKAFDLLLPVGCPRGYMHRRNLFMVRLQAYSPSACSVSRTSLLSLLHSSLFMPFTNHTRKYDVDSDSAKARKIEDMQSALKKRCQGKVVTIQGCSLRRVKSDSLQDHGCPIIAGGFVLARTRTLG